MRFIRFSVLALLIFTILSFGSTNTTVLQEGNNGYTGCEDAIILNTKGKQQMEATDKKILDPNNDRMEVVFFTC